MVDRSDDSRTPVAQAAYGLSGEFDLSSTFWDVASSGPDFGGMQNNVQPSAVFPPAPALFETSPTNNKDWMSIAEQTVGTRRIPNRMRNKSTPRSSLLSRKRNGNGISKKPARFNIPPDQSLNNLNKLIANCEDEAELGELKTQRRLIRNRQAAYDLPKSPLDNLVHCMDSRERKNQHVKDLQNQNNIKAEHINHLKEEIRSRTVQVRNCEREKEQILRNNADLSRQLEQLIMDIGDLVRDHTLETGELRKRITILTERLNESGMNTSSNSAAGEFGDFATDMDNLTMDSEWDEYSFINDLNGDGDMAPAQNQTTIIVAPRKDATVDSVAS